MALHDFEVEINTATRKRKAPEADKTKKPKWKSDEIKTLIDELEKRSCLWDVFGKDYHEREKREVAYTELEDILKHTKQYIGENSGPEDATWSRNCQNKLLEVKTSNQSTWVFFDRQFLHDVVEIALSSLLLIHCLVFTLPGFLSSSFKTSKATKTASNSKPCCKHTRHHCHFKMAPLHVA